MRCVCCDAVLTDYEATIRDVHNAETDMCLECILNGDLEIVGTLAATDRPDLRSELEEIGFANEERYDEGSLYDQNWD